MTPGMLMNKFSHLTILLLTQDRFIYRKIGLLVKYTQTLALIEVVNTVFGFVKASPFTTAIQVSSRLLLVWGICHQFPIVGENVAYSSMIFAWSITEVGN